MDSPLFSLLKWSKGENMEQKLLFTNLSLVIVLSTLLILSCSSSKNCENDLTYHTGTITVVGNEPFTILALQVSGDETYILDCDEELTRKLWKEQGRTYKVGFCKTEKRSRGTALIVIEAEPAENKD